MKDILWDLREKKYVVVLLAFVENFTNFCQESNEKI